MSKSKHIGSSFDDFLVEEGIYAEVNEAAIKAVLAWRISEEMKRKNMTKSAMAEAMGTSRSALDRLLDPENDSVTLKTLERAAAVLGKRISISLEDFVAAAQ